MFTLIAYSDSLDTSGVLTYLPALADQHVRVEGNNVVVPAGMNNLLGAFAAGDTIKRAQIESPALRRTLLLDLPEVNYGLTPLNQPPLFDAFYNPIPLDEYEPLRFLTAEEASGAARQTGLIWLGDGPQTPVGGEIYTVRAEAAVTLTPYAWTNGALSFSQVLPAGRYAVVGMSVLADGLLAARLVFVGGTWRPGVLGRIDSSKRSPAIFSRGGLGVWGEFAHDQPPTVDFLGNQAVASETVWLDLIKIG